MLIMANAFCNACSPCQEQNDIATNIMQVVEGMEDVKDLIVYIDQLINEIGRGFQEQVERPNSLATSVNSGGNLIEKLSKRFNWHVFKKWLLSSLDRQTRKLVIEVLNQAQIIQFVGMALSIIAHQLEREASSNEDERLHFLRYMSTLAKHMRNLNIHLERRKLGDILRFTLKATVICALQRKPRSLRRFICVPLDAADLENLKSELVYLYPDLEFQAQTEVLNRLDTFPGPSQGEYPQDAVGIEKAQDEVIKLLNLTDSSRRAVVIYGIGGIGKTTLATAVFNRFDLTDYHYCRVDMDQDFKQSDLQTKQEQMLRDLFNENWKLNNFTEGREKLREAFEKASNPLFLFIDNALRQSDLQMLLPIEHLSGLPMLRKILVTTRNLNEINIFRRHDDIQVYSHRVDPLSEGDAKRLLCHYALGDKNGSFDPDVDMDGLLQICGGIPLLLRIVGSKLESDGKTISAFNDILGCNDILEYLKEWKQNVFVEGEEEQNGFDGGKEDLSKSMVDFVYKQLREPSQEAFLDIAFFFYDWEQSKVRDIVGEMQLEDIKGAALVTISQEDKVKMHDIVRARGRRLSEGNRIINKESLRSLLNDNDVQKIQQLKGIWIPNDDNELSLEAKQLDLMSKTLRVLSLGKHSKLHGLCHRVFEELRFLHISYEDILSIDPWKSKHLVFFCAHFNYKEKHILKLPESLRLLRLDGLSGSSLWLDKGTNLASVRELELIGIDFQNFKTIIHGNFSCLKMLKLENTNWKELPEGFGNLSLLQTLSIGSCSNLKELPESFGNLSSLQTLSMDSCHDLKGLPESFGNLSSLQTLSMDSCLDLKGLPESFGHLSSLQTLSMDNCCYLGRLPESFGNLSSLQTLSMLSCSNLEELPESFGNLSSLQTLSMDRCFDLKGLPKSFGNLSSLQTLSMADCENMCILSDNFGQLKCLKYLSIRNCKKLERLPSDIVCSTTLAAMKAYGCVELEAKAMDSLVEIPSLMFLEMGESPMLIKRWEEIRQHRPLIAAVLRFERGNYPYGEIMSRMLFSARSRFLQIDGDGQLAEVALASFPEVGVKVGLLLTPCPPSDELRQTIMEVASKGFQIIYVHVEGEGKTEGSRWMEEREERIREIVVQLPEGSRVWTSPSNKTKLLFGYSLWEATGRVDACLVGTSVEVDGKGRRQLSHPFEMIFKTGSWDSQVELRTLFSPLSEAMDWMLSTPWDISAVNRPREISAVSRLPERGKAKRSSFHSSASDESADWDTLSELVGSKSVSYKPNPKSLKPSRWKPHPTPNPQ